MTVTEQRRRAYPGECLSLRGFDMVGVTCDRCGMLVPGEASGAGDVCACLRGPYSEVTRGVLVDVFEERTRQDAKWGQQDHEIPLWVTILSEEVGELAHAWLQYREHFPESVSLARRLGYLGAVRAEAIQVAAVAVALVEALDRSVGADTIARPA